MSQTLSNVRVNPSNKDHIITYGMAKFEPNGTAEGWATDGFQFSMDGGRSWNAWRALGDGTTDAFVDYSPLNFRSPGWRYQLAQSFSPFAVRLEERRGWGWGWRSCGEQGSGGGEQVGAGGGEQVAVGQRPPLCHGGQWRRCRRSSPRSNPCLPARL